MYIIRHINEHTNGVNMYLGIKDHSSSPKKNMLHKLVLICMIKIVEGDLFSAPNGIICHQVNCKGNMGRGVAKTFKQK